MFITKKKYEKALAEQKAKIEMEWERKWCEREERNWQERNRCENEERTNRHFSELEKRVYVLEKKAGLVEDTVRCPFEVKTANY